MRALEDQVRVEFEASLQYILMAAHFDQVRPGWVEGMGQQERFQNHDEGS